MGMGRKGSFMVMMSLTTGFFLVELIVGYMTNSMALVADSFHMLSGKNLQKRKKYSRNRESLY